MGELPPSRHQAGPVESVPVKKPDPFYATPEWKALRLEALKRDHFRCVACGDRARTVDHIVRRRDGGADALPNLRSLCITCDNRVKEDARGARRNGGTFGVIGVDGWPIA